jgi:hypothetical protein
MKIRAAGLAGKEQGKCIGTYAFRPLHSRKLVRLQRKEMEDI